MPLYESYLRGRIVIPEYKPIDINTILHLRAASRVVAPGSVKDITPMAMQMKESHDVWGCTYEVVAHDDEDQTGVLRMRANSAFGWGFVYKDDESQLVRVIGSHTFPMGPKPLRDIFLFARRTNEGAAVDKILEWRPRRARNK